VAAQEKAASIPEAAIADLDGALAATDAESSPARQRLALKRVLRDGEKLIEGHPDAANRFEILSILFRGQQALYAMDDSPRNREAVLDVAGRLAQAPDDYVALRLDADLLLSQAEVTRQGGDVEARGRALAALVERYRDSPVEGKVLRIAMVMALELGDQTLVDRLRETMAERFATDLDMIAFQREKLGVRGTVRRRLRASRRPDDAVSDGHSGPHRAARLLVEGRGAGQPEGLRHRVAGTQGSVCGPDRDREHQRR
jgi:hypothetical protein